MLVLNSLCLREPLNKGILLFMFELAACYIYVGENLTHLSVGAGSDFLPVKLVLTLGNILFPWELLAAVFHCSA